MHTIMYDSYEQMSKAAGEMVIEQLTNKPDSVLGLATGSTPLGLYRALVDAYRAGRVDFSQAVSFNLDEYYHPQPFYYIDELGWMGRLHTSAPAIREYLEANGLSTSQYEWEFTVIQDDQTVNAWAMPGGKVAVYTGILPIAQGDAGLAVVMSHEIAHAVARHGNERMTQGLLVDLGGLAISEALQKQPEQTRGLFLASYGVGTQIGALLPYSRLHESEADRIGLTLMARAGYDPREAIPFWQRMNQTGGPRPPEFLSTHPAPASRIANIETYLPEALALYSER